MPLGYRRHVARRRAKLDAPTGFIDEILHNDVGVAKKQRPTIQRVYARLREERGFDGGYTTVRDDVHPRRLSLRAAFVPLAHPAGHAQADFGEAWAVIGGVTRKVRFVVIALPHSDAIFVKAYPAETAEAFCDGHVAVFAFFGGVAQSVLYDNTRLAVAKILGDGTRSAVRYSRPCNLTMCSRIDRAAPARGTTRARSRGWWVLPGGLSWCPLRGCATLPISMSCWRPAAGNGRVKPCAVTKAAVGVRLQADRAAFQDFPAVPFEACDKRPGRVTSQALIRYKHTDYSVPVAYAHRDTMVKACVEEVVIVADGQEIARHRRSYEAGDLVFNPLHYLALLEQKVGALDQAAPLQGWDLPTEFATLRRLLEARLSPKNRCAPGKREYVQVLRLIETFPLATVHGAVRDALHLNAISYDAVKHVALCRVEKRRPKLDVAAYPHLPVARVTTTSASSYMSLLSGEPA